KDKLKGLVKSLTVTRVSRGYDERNDRVYEKPAQLVEQSKYDLDGNRVERGGYLDGKLIATQTYAYDDEGFMIRRIIHNEYGTGKGAAREYEITRAESMSEKFSNRMFSGTFED